YLIPAYISAFKNTDSVKALNILLKVPEKPANFQIYIRPITTALENILINRRDFQSYTSLYHRLPEWGKLEFDAIIAKKSFKQHGVQNDIIAFHNKQRHIKIGIGLFPDLLLLDLAAK